MRNLRYFRWFLSLLLFGVEIPAHLPRCLGFAGRQTDFVPPASGPGLARELFRLAVGGMDC